MVELVNDELLMNPASRMKDVFVSAVQLAKLAGVKPSDIHYWGRFGYLARRENRGAPYPLDQLPKAQLLGLFTRRLSMRAEKAAQLADQLMRLYPDHPDIGGAAIDLLKAIEIRIDEVASLLVEANLTNKIHELAVKEAS